MISLPRALVGALAAGLLTSAPLVAAPEPAFRTAEKLGHGVNVLGYDGIWSGGIDAPFRVSDFALIRKAGFKHVRINIFAFRYLDAGLRLDQAMLGQLDAVLDHATAAGLMPVIDEHDYESCQADPVSCAVKLKAFWHQVSARYTGRYPDAVFEILNEPGGGMTQEAWNVLAGEVLHDIRASNPARTIIVAALNSEDPHQPSHLALPSSDRNIIVTVHYYKPFLFTYQGAPWSAELAKLHDIGWGSKADEQQITEDFGIIDAWAKSIGRPLYLGEFGVFEGAPMTSRTRYLSFVTQSADRLGWSWAYWQFDHDFALFDRARDGWVEPVLRAVMPAQTR